jgi:hypothetical protein
VSRPRPPRQTARQERLERLKREYRRRPPGPILLNGTPVDLKRIGRLPEFLRRLTLYRDLTDDPCFDDALRALAKYEFDINDKALRKWLFGDFEMEGHLTLVAYFCEGGDMSIYDACAFVVSTFGLGPGFETAVERLRKAYMVKNPHRKKTRQRI